LVHGHAHHRDRHSFPTRRSSDLREHQLALLEKARDDRSALLIAPTGAGKTLAGFLPTLVELSSLSTAVRSAPLPPRSGGEGSGVDRKSTRLNSSHLVISYAVFCL